MLIDPDKQKGGQSAAFFFMKRFQPSVFAFLRASIIGMDSA